MMGARTIVDMYMNDAVGDIGGFAKKLNKLVVDGHLGGQDKDAGADDAADAQHHQLDGAERPVQAALVASKVSA